MAGIRRSLAARSATSATLSDTRLIRSSRRCVSAAVRYGLELTDHLVQWAVASLSAGAILGTLIGGTFSDKWVEPSRPPFRVKELTIASAESVARRFSSLAMCSSPSAASSSAPRTRSSSSSSAAS